MNFSVWKKRIPAYILCASLCFTFFTGCNNSKSSDKNGNPASSDYDEKKSMSDYQICLDETSKYDDISNYKMPKKGDEIVVMTIRDKGDVKIRLFPELLPRACVNFKGLVKSGYYDGLSFHKVIENFMIQSGDPTASGTGGESVWGGEFDGGKSKYLFNVSGALAYANAGATSSDSSQFYIVAGQKYTEESLKPYIDEFGYSKETIKAYTKNGGAPWLDGGDCLYTVFGQVYEGLDIVTDICSNTVTDNDHRPVDDVIIEKVVIEEYKK